MNRKDFIRFAGYAGLIGPILFGATLAALTFIQYDFMLSLGWHPLHAPTFDWPSGLALGPIGWLMTAAFILSGAAMMVFGIGLSIVLSNKPGAILMSLAGLFMMGLAFTTDPTIRSTPATWHGRLHDLSFLLLGLTLMPAMILLGFAFRRDENWKGLSFYTWGTALLALPTFFLKGIAFYVFLFSVLLWSEVIATHFLNEA